MIFFSLLTGTRNRATLLRAAIESVVGQQFSDCEHLVVDAMSTDETPGVLAEYPQLRVIREPDDGFFDGLNKAVRHARGDVIGLLNSDDLLPPGALQSVAAAFRDPAIEVVTGACDFFVEEADRPERVLRVMTDPAQLELSLHNMLRGNPVINARFFRREFVARVGEFDQSFPIAGDREWLIRAALAKPRQTVIDTLVYRYRQHEGSLTIHETSRNVARYRAEHVAIAEKLLAQPNLMRSEARALRGFHTRESAALAAESCFAGQFAETKNWARRGCQKNQLWPLAFGRRLIGYAVERSATVHSGPGREAAPRVP